MTAPLSEQRLAEIAAGVSLPDRDDLRKLVADALSQHPNGWGVNRVLDLVDSVLAGATKQSDEDHRKAYRLLAEGFNERGAEVERLKGEFGNAVATVARLEQKRVELERIANAERARVAELEAEREELNGMVRSSNAKAADALGLRRALALIAKHGDMSETVRQELRDLLVIPKSGDPR